MSAFVQLSDDDAGVECRRWLRSINKDGTREVKEAKRAEEPKDEEGDEEPEEEVKTPAKKGAPPPPTASAGAGGAGAKGKAEGKAKAEEPKKTKKEVKEAKEEVEAALTATERVELLERTFLPLVEKIVANNTEADVEVGFTLALHVLREHADTKVQLSLLGKFAAALAARPETATLTKLKWLTVLFNSPLLDSLGAAGLAQRSSIYFSILRSALATGTARELSGSYTDIDAWIAEWKLPKAQIAELYLLISKLSKAADDIAESKAFTLKYLRALQSGDLPLGPAKEIAVAAVLELLQADDMPPYDEYLSLTAVQQLQSDTKYAHIFKLLRIFASETIDSYTAFLTEKKDALAGTGLSHDDVVRKLRTLTICSLGATTDRVTYADLQTKLSLASAADVEAAVIDAVLSGRLEAKLDQDKSTVLIQRAAPRSFTAGSWRDLSAKLTLWQRNVHTVLATLNDVQSGGGGGASDGSSSSSSH